MWWVEVEVRSWSLGHAIRTPWTVLMDTSSLLSDSECPAFIYICWEATYEGWEGVVLYPKGHSAHLMLQGLRLVQILLLCYKHTATEARATLAIRAPRVSVFVLLSSSAAFAGV